MDLSAGLILGVVASLIAGVILSEVEAWTPRLCRQLVRVAVRQLPVELRERFEEEWLADLDDRPGAWSKLLVALGFPIAGLRIGPLTRFSGLLVRSATLRRAFAAALLWVCGPFIVTIATLILLEGQNPFVVEFIGVEGQRDIQVVRFRTRDHTGKFTPLGRWLENLGVDELPMLASALVDARIEIGPFRG